MTLRHWLGWMAALFLLASCGSVGTGTPPRTITVSGTGTIEKAPDVVNLSVQINSRFSSPTQALADNNQRTQAVLGALNDLGVDPADIYTSYFTVTPQYQYDQNGNPTGVVDYWVDNSLAVRLRQVGKLGDLLQQVISSGATGVSGISYDFADPDALTQQAKVLAVQDAHRKAVMLAEASGLSLGAPRMIDSGGNIPVTYGGIGGGGGGGGVPVSTGTLGVTLQATVVFDVK